MCPRFRAPRHERDALEGVQAPAGLEELHLEVHVQRPLVAGPSSGPLPRPARSDLEESRQDRWQVPLPLTQDCVAPRADTDVQKAVRDTLSSNTAIPESKIGELRSSGLSDTNKAISLPLPTYARLRGEGTFGWGWGSRRDSFGAPAWSMFP